MRFRMQSREKLLPSLFGLRAIALLPLTCMLLIVSACSGEDRPTVDVIQGSPGAGGATTGSVSASGADVAGPQPTQIPGAAYNVVSNVDSYFAIGPDLRDVRALLSVAAEGRRVDWAAVTALYEQGKNQKLADGSTRSLASLLTEGVYAQFPNGASVYGNPTFIDRTVRDAIAGSGRASGLSENARRNLVDKALLMLVYGKALEELDAASSSIAANNLDPNTGAPHAVDEAYAALAGATDGSGIRSYAVFGAATSQELYFKLGGMVRNPLEAALTNAQRAAVAGDAAAYERAFADVRGLLNAVYYLGALRYAKAVEIQTSAAAREGGIAEGWAYWQTIRAAVTQASPAAARTVEEAFTQGADRDWPASLTASVYSALNEPAVLSALGIPADVQVKTPPP
jgi:hypothetical protein